MYNNMYQRDITLFNHTGWWANFSKIYFFVKKRKILAGKIFFKIYSIGIGLIWNSHILDWP